MKLEDKFPIGEIRRWLFIEGSDPWNGLVRDMTADLEIKWSERQRQPPAKKECVCPEYRNSGKGWACPAPFHVDEKTTTREASTTNAVSTPEHVHTQLGVTCPECRPAEQVECNCFTHRLAHTSDCENKPPLPREVEAIIKDLCKNYLRMDDMHLAYRLREMCELVRKAGGAES